MTKTQELLELAERCEKATGADTELSFAIYAALNPEKDCSGIKRSQRYLYGEPYTASLDAAMTLLDDDWFFHISRFSPASDGRGEAHVYPNRGLGDDYEAEAATVALALCAASLRARV